MERRPHVRSYPRELPTIRTNEGIREIEIDGEKGYGSMRTIIGSLDAFVVIGKRCGLFENEESRTKDSLRLRETQRG